MTWPEISIDDFPPERDDEPSSLRQDIIDELSDHFACALNRELLKNPDEQTAKQRVLNQFGDPIKIARQLWLEAMQEKIMSQRIMTGVSVVMALCGFIVVGLVWSMMKESQDFNARMMAQMAEIADRPEPVTTDAVNQQILKQLEQLNQNRTVEPDTVSVGMNQLSFQLVADDNDEKPPNKYVGTLTKIGDRSETFTLEAVSNGKGVLDYGKLPWGKYQLTLKSPWGEYHHQSVTVIPGRDTTQKIICPTEIPEVVSVRFHLDWPDGINTEDWFLICDFRNSSDGNRQVESSRLIHGEKWIYRQNWTEDKSGVYLINNENMIGVCPVNKDGEYEDIDLKQLALSSSTRMRQGKHVLPDLMLFQKKDLQNLAQMNRIPAFQSLNKSRTAAGSYSLQYRAMVGGATRFGGIEGNSFLIIPFQNHPPPWTQVKVRPEGGHTLYASGLELSKRLEFTAIKGEKNLWKIKLPDLKDYIIPKGTPGGGQGIF
ncbi:hypothetical protein Pan241w_44550 [Gimesia alba]|uniref:Uncharacterized protein n=1 Tax=Gimesia alba TaxID=2527973 RepID=A0A517RKD5_9PLAN|nr:hypothetical protein [Gimesia alba]QDT44346.1 hypothetical protein Pan241w_44550 [Gimesia alba]